ncbi:hypothetical protein GYMLUDRAFT_88181 [Collybiopsis luxurians FD-317 M1]|uniref:Uncharacterized protein n=1 Tax=Collybiopsis luxurians FD-317 M1 TaxID=944289 RepID=A0A0D0C878_9AGAR|nr:hypothetical protein GYMLUDRAFT_88181 [Collybiopsis luxurians FD-317 M1]
MSTASHFPGTSGRSGLAPRTGRNTFISIAFLASGFAGFFYMLNQRDEKRKSSGKMHQYEEALHTQPAGPVVVNDTNSPILSAIPKAPTSTHNAQHFTRTPGWTTDTDGIHSHHSAGGHIHQPAPQRDRGDGSGLAYTKKSV